MANAVKWAAPSTIADAMTTELNALASSARVLATNPIDNETDRRLYATFELNVTFASAPTAGRTVDLYLVPALDGTNYADGGASVVPSPAMRVGSFIVQAVATAQKLVIQSVPLPPHKFKPLILNNTPVAFTASGHTVKFRAFNEELQ